MIAIYARQSVERQASISIQMQIEACLGLIPANTPTRVYTDRGFTGTNTARPGFRKLMQDVQAGEIAGVYVYKLDRISRSLCDFAGMMQAFRQHGVELRSVRENFDTHGEIGSLLLHLLMMFAELEQKTIAGRVRDNYYARAQAHLPLGGVAPYGFAAASVLKGSRASATLSPIQAEADRVVWFYRQYGLRGENVEQLVHGANQAGVVTRKGKRWSNSGVVRILRNPVYLQGNLAAWRYFQGREIQFDHPTADYCQGNGWIWYGRQARNQGGHLAAGLHQGLVEPELWLEVQHRLDSRQGHATRGTGQTSWLQGRVVCGLCGSPCYARNNGAGSAYTYFVCRGKRQGICPGIPALRAAAVEQAVEAVVLQQGALALAASPTPQTAPDPVEIALAELDARLAQLAQELAQATAGAPYLRQELEQLATRRQALERSHRLARESVPKDDTEAWHRWWHQATLSQRRRAAEIVIGEVRAFPGHLEVRS